MSGGWLEKKGKSLSFRDSFDRILLHDQLGMRFAERLLLPQDFRSGKPLVQQVRHAFGVLQLLAIGGAQHIRQQMVGIESG